MLYLFGCACADARNRVMDAMLSHRLVPEQVQRISPQIIFSAALLQMTIVELREHIKQELLENPMLEEAEPQVEEKPEPWEEMIGDQEYEWPRNMEKK